MSIFYNGENYCESYDCTMTGYLNEKVEDKEILSLCQVLENGTVVHNKVPYDDYVELTFEIPQVRQERKLHPQSWHHHRSFCL